MSKRINERYHVLLSVRVKQIAYQVHSGLTYRYVGEDSGGEQLSGFLHLGFLRAAPHALTPHFIPNVFQCLKEQNKKNMNM